MVANWQRKLASIRKQLTRSILFLWWLLHWDCHWLSVTQKWILIWLTEWVSECLSVRLSIWLCELLENGTVDNSSGRLASRRLRRRYGWISSMAYRGYNNWRRVPTDNYDRESDSRCIVSELGDNNHWLGDDGRRMDTDREIDWSRSIYLLS